jgi:hypothetical protein
MSNPHSEYDEGELKRMIRAQDMKIAKLQGEKERIKGELDQCLDRMQKLQRQLLNGDFHRGRNYLQTKELDLYDRTNQNIISQFCKMKKSSIDGNRYLVYLWKLGELPVYIYWWCWRFAPPDVCLYVRYVRSENQGFFTPLRQHPRCGQIR